MADASKEIRARGLLFKTFSQWCNEECAMDPLETLKPKLEDETVKILRSAEKGAWYPVWNLVDALDAITEPSPSSPSSDPQPSSDNQPPSTSSDPLLQFGIYLCQSSLTTSFRGLIVFIDPVTLMKRMPLFWKRYFSGGELNTEKVEQSNAILTIADSFNQQTLCRMFSGWLKHALEMVGADRVNVTEKKCRWNISWQWTEN